MRIKNYKCKCGSESFMFMKKNRVENVMGIYCNQCGKWLKWADRDEKNLYKLHQQKEK